MREAPRAPALFEAIKAGDLEKVKAMVSEDPSLVNARDADGTAILTAVYHRQAEIVNLLVARGASLALFEAGAAGEIERVGRRIGGWRLEVNGYTADGGPPLDDGRLCG